MRSIHGEPEHDSCLPLRRQSDALGSTTGHAAVHVVAGAGGTVAARSNLVGGQASLDLRPVGLGLVLWSAL
jgi:hypothetical protein